MEDNIFDKVHEVDLKQTMETSYIDYAMSVIASRALPDVRDGLKPVQRRIMYSMIELNNGPDKPHRKCARIVGDTMGKYHPHGDSSIYGALVNMAQEWSTRYPLVDGHGNFGSVDGDGAAAMRYTEARLSKISMELTADINKNTVDFIPNFDETEKEPTVLPSRFPNLLVNGTSGIAVGMATNIPPHNLREVINAVVQIIDDQIEDKEETTIEEILKIIKGPDFPTGGMILGTRGIEEAYRTGRGKIRVRAVTDIETMPNGKSRIIVSELPYMVNKARLIEKIAELVRDKKIDGITDLSDQSSREGMRVVIELRRDANANVILNQLYKHTQLQDTFGVIMLALVGNEPKVMNLMEMLNYYLKHQEEVVTRRTQYELNKAEERAHILKGLLIALDNIDEVIKIIRGSQTVQIAKSELMERFGLTDPQSQAIVDMRLRALTGLEREKLEAEYKELMAKIAESSEPYLDYRTYNRRDVKRSDHVISNALSSATVRTAEILNAKAIIVPTMHGFTANLLSNWRPKCRIIGMSPNWDVLRKMQLNWGVTPVKAMRETDTDELIEHSVNTVKEMGYIESGDTVIVTVGVKHKNQPSYAIGETNNMRVIVVN